MAANQKGNEKAHSKCNKTGQSKDGKMQWSSRLREVQDWLMLVAHNGLIIPIRGITAVRAVEIDGALKGRKMH
jgi:hypothetical protein